jgi:hypothetical protein
MPAFAFLWYGLVTDVAFIVTAAVLSLGYGLALVFWTRRILDRIVPPEIRDQVLKERRREARREERAAQSEVATPTTDAKAANPASDDRHGDL